jgi:BolA protein
MNHDRIAQIEEKLRTAFSPSHLEIIDESHLHAGHAGARDGKGHFKVAIIADDFSGKSMIKRHRMIYGALDSLLESDIHALTIEAQAPAD